MFTTSLRDLLTGTFREEVTDITQTFDPDIQDHHLYLFADGDLPLYVGQSGNILIAVETHAWYRTSTIGRLVWSNIPRSHNWQVTFFTVQECVNTYWDSQEQMRKRAKELGVAVTEVERHPLPNFSQSKAKTALIQYYNPCLNLADRLYKRELPSTYILPQTDLLDGLSSIDRKGTLSEWFATYKTFDWSTMENKQCRKTIRATSYQDCKKTVVHFLGYEPEELRITPKPQFKPEDMPF